MHSCTFETEARWEVEVFFVVAPDPVKAEFSTVCCELQIFFYYIYMFQRPTPRTQTTQILSRSREESFQILPRSCAEKKILHKL